LLIPLEPRSEGALSFVPTEDPETGEFTDDSEAVARLAVGEGYPTTMQYSIGGALVYTDTALLIASGVSIDAVASIEASADIEASVEDDSLLEIHVNRAGIHRLQ